MYDSKLTTILVDQDAKKTRTEILSRLYGMDFNLIPVNGKHPPCSHTIIFSCQRSRSYRGAEPGKAGVALAWAAPFSFHSKGHLSFLICGHPLVCRS